MKKTKCEDSLIWDNMTQKCNKIGCCGTGELMRNPVRENGVRYSQYYYRCLICNETWESPKTIQMTNNSMKIAKQKIRR